MVHVTVVAIVARLNFHTAKANGSSSWDDTCLLKGQGHYTYFGCCLGCTHSLRMLEATHLWNHLVRWDRYLSDAQGRSKCHIPFLSGSFLKPIVLPEM